MASEKFLEKYRDPRWQKKRLEILERDQWQCRKCCDGSSTLHVHHQFYKSGADPWDYENFCLITLCDSCHETLHEEKKDALQSIQVALARRDMDYEFLSAMCLALDESGEWKDPNLTVDDIYAIAGIVALALKMRNVGMPVYDTAVTLRAKYLELRKAAVDA